jgi:hypothetical protein
MPAIVRDRGSGVVYDTDEVSGSAGSIVDGRATEVGILFSNMHGDLHLRVI